jgi:hypothetical protein
MPLTLSWIEFAKGIDDGTPNIVLSEIAEFYKIPHSHLNRQQLIVELHNHTPVVVNEKLANPTDVEALGEFLNRFAFWTDRKILVDAYQWLLNARDYDPQFPFGIQTQQNFKVYSPIMLYRICKRNGLNTHPLSSMDDMRILINPPDNLKDIFNPSSDVDAYNEEQLEYYLYEEGYFIDECENKSIFEKVREIYSLDTFSIGFPLGCRHLEHNKEDKFGRHVNYETCFVYGPREQIKFNERSRITCVPPEQATYHLYDTDELIYFFKENKRLIDPYTGKEFPSYAIKKLQYISKGSKLERVIKENKKTYITLQKYITKLSKWYSSFVLEQQNLFEDFLKQLMNIGFLIGGMQPYESLKNGEKDLQFSLLWKDLNFLECFGTLKVVDCVHDEYFLREETLKQMIENVEKNKTNEDFGCFLVTSGYFYLENVCGVDVAEPKTPRR